MQDSVRQLLGRRKNRSIAIILSTKEDECDEYLPAESSHLLRKVVLDQLNEFHDLALDIMESLDTGRTMINDHWLEQLLIKLDQIYDKVDYDDE